MSEFNKYIGLDVHKATIAVSIADGEGGDVRFFGEIENNPFAIAKLIKQLSKADEKLSLCYEAGGCGYVIFRQLRELNQDCIVVAPSLIPRKAGDRVKTDRRDSLNLARLHRAGELTPVWVPDELHEALRDLTRGREDIKNMEKRSKQVLLAFLLRHGRTFTEKSTWTKAHFSWLETVKFTHPAQQIMFQEYVDIIKMHKTKLESMDKQILTYAHASTSWPVIEALMSLRGINLLAATTIVAEIGDLRRFATAPQMMSFLGLVPSEKSSGGSIKKGNITKTGNSHVRRLLVEASWTYRHNARKTAHIQRKAKHTTDEVQEISWSAQKRLCQRYRELGDRGKLKVQVCTAIARELTGYIWAIGQVMYPRLPLIN